MKNPIQKSTRRLLPLASIALIVAATAVFANAATITVDRTDDNAAAAACTAAPNDCSLRGALAYANANSGTTVSVPAGNYALSLGELTFGGGSNLNTIVIGASPATTIIRQTAAATRVLNINPTVTPNVAAELRNLTLRDGETPAGNGGGGAIYAGGPGNSLTIVNCRFINNRAVLSDQAYGGAIDFNGGGTLTIDQSVFDGNLAGNPANTAWGFGGAINFIGRTNSSSLTVTNSTFTNNIARGVVTDYAAGGALNVEIPAPLNVPQTVTITHNRFIGNQAVGTGATAGQGRGGALGYSGNRQLTFRYNFLSGNVAPSGGSGVYSRFVAGTAIDATLNWWNCNAGPSSPQCDSAGDAAANVATSPRLVMSFTSNPSSAAFGQQCVLTASMATDSSGNPVAPANLAAISGLDVAFGNAVNGTLSVNSTAFNTSGNASTTMTIAGIPVASAEATFGNQTLTANVTVTRAASTTSITADTPDPSALSQSVTINFSVATGGGPTPTGNVTVSDGTSSCTAPVSAGQCTIAFGTYGNRVLTASYAGDVRYLPSTSTGEPHSVCSAVTAVFSTNNTGAGSLRNAVAIGCDGGSVTFSPAFLSPQTISLTGGQILVDKSLTISGPGANLLTIRNTAAASATSRVFEVANGVTLTLSGATISGGNLNGNAPGAGIYFRTGSLRLNNVVISGNQTSGIGGGLAGDAASLLEMTSSTVSDNVALASNGNGGGIYSEGTVRIVNSTIARNSASNGSFNAGGIFTAGNGLIANTTITDNLGTADGAGGVFSFNPILLTNNLIAANRNNSTVADVIGFFDANSSYNLVGNVGGNLSLTSANQNILGSSASVVDPRFELDGANRPNLILNGGSTPTVRLLGDSPAIDKGVAVDIQFLAAVAADPLAPLTVDQRGQTRPVDIAGIANAPGGNGSDIGSFEIQTPTAAGAEISGRVLTADGRGIRNVRLVLTNASGVSRVVVTGTFGYYRFEDVATGETYTLSAEGKRYQFPPHIFAVNDNITDFNFIAPE